MMSFLKQKFLRGILQIRILEVFSLCFRVFFEICGLGFRLFFFRFFIRSGNGKAISQRQGIFKIILTGSWMYIEVTLLLLFFCRGFVMLDLSFYRIRVLNRVAGERGFRNVRFALKERGLFYMCFIRFLFRYFVLVSFFGYGVFVAEGSFRGD